MRPKAKAKPKPKPAPAPRLDPFADEPKPDRVAEALAADGLSSEPEILSLDDEPEPAASADPFAFAAAPELPPGRAERSPTPARGKKGLPEPDEEGEPPRPAYRRSAQQSSKAPLIAAILGLIALGTVIALVVVSVTKKKDEPQAKAKVEAKEDKTDAETPPPENKDEANKDDKDAKKDQDIVRRGRWHWSSASSDSALKRRRLLQRP